MNKCIILRLIYWLFSSLSLKVDIDGDGRIDYDGILIKTFKKNIFFKPFFFTRICGFIKSRKKREKFRSTINSKNFFLKIKIKTKNNCKIIVLKF